LALKRKLNLFDLGCNDICGIIVLILIPVIRSILCKKRKNKIDFVDIALCLMVVFHFKKRSF